MCRVCLSNPHRCCVGKGTPSFEGALDSEVPSQEDPDCQLGGGGGGVGCVKSRQTRRILNKQTKAHQPPLNLPISQL